MKRKSAPPAVPFRKKAILTILTAAIIISGAYFIKLQGQRDDKLEEKAAAAAELERLQAEVAAKQWYIEHPDAAETKEWLAYNNGYIKPGDVVVRTSGD